MLSPNETQGLRQLCGRALYHTLGSSVRVYGAGAHHAFVATGDIPDEWIRDSSVQLGVYLPRIAAHPSLRQVGEPGGGRRDCHF
jgi:meiotically up-regulated gene 157 (Mug157) protein